MTYKELLEYLQTLTESQLTDTVTVYSSDTDEFQVVEQVSVNKGNDVLHDNHVYLEVY